MSMKWIGAILIIAGCAAVGFSMAMAHRKEEAALRQLIGALDYMGCELQYHLTPLPLLCKSAAGQCSGPVSQTLQCLSKELEAQIAPDAVSCMEAAISKTPTLPKQAENSMRALGNSLGKFDLHGQLAGIDGIRLQCRKELDALTKDRDVRLRSYQTLGLCAGSALAILLF